MKATVWIALVCLLFLGALDATNDKIELENSVSRIFNILSDTYRRSGEKGEISFTAPTHDILWLNAFLSTLPYLAPGEAKSKLSNIHFMSKQWSLYLSGLYKLRNSSTSHSNSLTASLTREEIQVFGTLLNLFQGVLRSLSLEGAIMVKKMGSESLPNLLNQLVQNWKINRDEVIEAMHLEGRMIPEFTDDMLVREEEELDLDDLMPSEEIVTPPRQQVQQIVGVFHMQPKVGDRSDMSDTTAEEDPLISSKTEIPKEFSLSRQVSLPDRVQAVKGKIDTIPKYAVPFFQALWTAFKTIIDARKLHGERSHHKISLTQESWHALGVALSAIPFHYNHEYAEALAGSEQSFGERQWSIWLGVLVKIRTAQNKPKLVIDLDAEELDVVSRLLQVFYEHYKTWTQKMLDVALVVTFKMSLNELLSHLASNWGLSASLIKKIGIIDKRLDLNLSSEEISQIKMSLLNQEYLDVMMAGDVSLPDYPEIKDPQLSNSWTQKPEKPMAKDQVFYFNSPPNSRENHRHHRSSRSGLQPKVTNNGLREYAQMHDLPNANEALNRAAQEWLILLKEGHGLRNRFSQVAGEGQVAEIDLEEGKLNALLSLCLLVRKLLDSMRASFSKEASKFGENLMKGFENVVHRVLYMVESVARAKGESHSDEEGGVRLVVSPHQARSMIAYLSIVDAALSKGTVVEPLNQLHKELQNLDGWVDAVLHDMGTPRASYVEEVKIFLLEQSPYSIRKVATTEIEQRQRMANEYGRQLTATIHRVLGLVQNAMIEDEKAIGLPISANHMGAFLMDLLRTFNSLTATMQPPPTPLEAMGSMALATKLENAMLRTAAGETITHIQVPTPTMQHVASLLRRTLEVMSRSDPLVLHETVQASAAKDLTIKAVEKGVKLTGIQTSTFSEIIRRLLDVELAPQMIEKVYQMYKVEEPQEPPIKAIPPVPVNMTAVKAQVEQIEERTGIQPKAISETIAEGIMEAIQVTGEKAGDFAQMVTRANLSMSNDAEKFVRQAISSTEQKQQSHEAVNAIIDIINGQSNLQELTSQPELILEIAKENTVQDYKGPKAPEIIEKELPIQQEKTVQLLKHVVKKVTTNMTEMKVIPFTVEEVKVIEKIAKQIKVPYKTLTAKVKQVDLATAKAVARKFTTKVANLETINAKAIMVTAMPETKHSIATIIDEAMNVESGRAQMIPVGCVQVPHVDPHFATIHRKSEENSLQQERGLFVDWITSTEICV